MIAATLAGERELATAALQAMATVAVGAVTYDAWRWLRHQRSVRCHPASRTGQPSRVYPSLIHPTKQVHDWALTDEARP